MGEEAQRKSIVTITLQATVAAPREAMKAGLALGEGTDFQVTKIESWPDYSSTIRTSVG